MSIKSPSPVYQFDADQDFLEVVNWHVPPNELFTSQSLLKNQDEQCLPDAFFGAFDDLPSFDWTDSQSQVINNQPKITQDTPLQRQSQIRTTPPAVVDVNSRGDELKQLLLPLLERIENLEKELKRFHEE